MRRTCVVFLMRSLCGDEPVVAQPRLFCRCERTCALTPLLLRCAVSTYRVQLEAESQLISAAVEEHEHEKERAGGFVDQDDIDSSPTDWHDGGGIVAATSAMLAKAPAKYKTASPTSSPRAELDASDRGRREARDQELDKRKKALHTRQLELGRLRTLCDVRLGGAETREPESSSPRHSPRSTQSPGGCSTSGMNTPGSTANGLSSSHDTADPEVEQEAAAADSQIKAQFTALSTLNNRWDEWRTWRRAKLLSELGKRAGMPRRGCGVNIFLIIWLLIGLCFVPQASAANPGVSDLCCSERVPTWTNVRFCCRANIRELWH